MTGRQKIELADIGDKIGLVPRLEIDVQVPGPPIKPAAEVQEAGKRCVVEICTHALTDATKKDQGRLYRRALPAGRSRFSVQRRRLLPSPLAA